KERERRTHGELLVEGFPYTPFRFGEQIGKVPVLKVGYPGDDRPTGEIVWDVEACEERREPVPADRLAEWRALREAKKPAERPFAAPIPWLDRSDAIDSEPVEPHISVLAHEANTDAACRRGAQQGVDDGSHERGPSGPRVAGRFR